MKLLSLFTVSLILYASGSATTESDAALPHETETADSLRSAYRRIVEARNRVGSKAADFNFINRYGSPSSLYEIITDKDILLVFYDPDCEDCMETLSLLSQKNVSGKFTVVAIDSEYDRTLWESTAVLFPKEWTVGFATDPIQEEDIYILEQYPTIYLLSKDKTVLKKNATLSELV